VAYRLPVWFLNRILLIYIFEGFHFCIIHCLGYLTPPFKIKLDCSIIYFSKSNSAFEYILLLYFRIMMMKISNPFSANLPQRSVPSARTQPSNKLTGLQKDTVHFSGKHPIHFAGGEVTEEDVKALAKGIASLVLDEKPIGDGFMELFNSKFKLRSTGLRAIKGDYCLGISCATEKGRDALVEKIFSLPGAKEEPGLKNLYHETWPDEDRNRAKIISLPFRDKQIPIIAECNGAIMTAHSSAMMGV
jgi:hypothetical protein